jgi:trans-2,3-dihydro-3-hydroxyanthranilate isomerase
MTAQRRKIPFHFVDVFADEPLTGNPLAIVPDADALGEDVMRSIAREFNQSETTFILTPSRAGADHRLRSFTPTGDEVFGAGHNALGAWWWLAEAGRLGALSDGVRAMQELDQTVLPVNIVASNGKLTMVGLTQGEPAMLAGHQHPLALAASLGLHGNDLVAESSTPPQIVSTGAPHLMVQAIDRAAVNRAHPDAAALSRELRSGGAQGCYLFCLDTVSSDATAHARFFNPTVGISEDPATGSAAGPLAWLLAMRGLASHGSEIIIEQGHQLGRPSRIVVHVGVDRVELRGRGVTVASGVLRV